MALRAAYDLAAPAKLNLFLHVVGRRADGYHLLQSVFMLIDWADTLHVERRAGAALSREDLGAPLPDDDLCLQAARALQAAGGVREGAHIAIDKRVPSGAGLGGGSSDAATVLLALNRLWGLHWPRSRLLAIAQTLGADVPFFVGGRNAWVEGIGEHLTSVAPLPPAWFAVVKPAVGVPTPVIFGSPALKRDTEPAIMSDFVADPYGFGRNDLEPCACAYSPEVGQALNMLGEHFGASRMSGSGSAVFAKAGDAVSGTGERPVDERWQATLPHGWTARLCRSLPAHPLVGWAAD
jgi:4-diphosphocytidyl-2-C-methyl-D-erythritol kinase